MASPSKREVRAALRERRRAIAAGRDVPTDSALLAEVGVDLTLELGLDEGDTVTLYESWAGEPPTGALVAALLARGIRVLVPITLPDLDLDWCDVEDPDRTPLGARAIAEAALVLAPGLAVDALGTRLGQGGGCYDRALPRRRDGIPALVLLHPGELGGSEDPLLPLAEHDQPVDGVLTAEGRTWLHPRG